MTLAEVLENHSEDIKNAFKDLRKILLANSPKLDEVFHGGAKVRMASYSISGKMV